MEKAVEYPLVIKTKAEYFSRVEEEIKKLHSYEVPEIIAVPIIRGNRKYLSWLEGSLK